MHRAIGIDLGTAFGRAVLQSQDGTQFVEFVDEQDSSRARKLRAEVALTPSRPDGVAPEMGTRAWRRTLLDAGIVRGAWALLGASLEELEDLAAPTAAALSFVSGERADVHVRGAAERSYSAVELSAAQLESLAVPIESQVQEPVVRGLVAVPLSFGATKLAALHQACVIAGLHAVEPIASTTALAVAYLSERPQAKGLHVVADLGAHDCSFALLNFRDGNEVEYIEASWSVGHGAWSLQRAVMDWIAQQVIAQLEEGQTELVAEPMIQARLWDAAERAMIALDSEERALVQLPYLWADEGGPRGIEVVLDRATFESLARPNASAITTAMRRLKDALDTRRGPVVAVLLAGGLAKVPVIRDAVESVFAIEPQVEDAAAEAVARALGRVLEIGARRFPSIRVRGQITRAEGERIWLVGQEARIDRGRARTAAAAAADDGSEAALDDAAESDQGDDEQDGVVGTTSEQVPATESEASASDEADAMSDEGFVRSYQVTRPMKAPGIIVWPVPSAQTLHLLGADAFERIATAAYARRVETRDQRRLRVLGPWLDGAIAAALREGERIAEHPGVGADTVAGLKAWTSEAREALHVERLESWESALIRYRELRRTLPAILMDGLPTPLGDAPPTEVPPQLERWLEGDFARPFDRQDADERDAARATDADDEGTDDDVPDDAADDGPADGPDDGPDDAPEAAPEEEDEVLEQSEERAPDDESAGLPSSDADADVGTDPSLAAPEQRASADEINVERVPEPESESDR